MNREQILVQLKSLVTDNLELTIPSDTSEDARVYDDLGIDSIMILQLVVYIEASFDIQIPDENVDPSAFETLGGLVDFIQELQGVRR